MSDYITTKNTNVIFPTVVIKELPTVVKFLKTPKFSGSTFVIKNGFSHGCHDGIFPHLSNFKSSEISRKHFCCPKWNFPMVVDGLMGCQKC